MCGISGVFIKNKQSQLTQLEAVVSEMKAAITHRGPDDSGIWCDYQSGIALAHNRLSIIDLSASGHQPMVSSSGRYVISFNGEIYNFNEIRKEITSENENVSWHGNSDTEVLLNCIDVFGLEITLNKIVGMFAFAVWDKKDKQLILVRDRMGEKPLYYGFIDGNFVFSSELKSISSSSYFKPSIDKESVDLYFTYGYIPAPYSIYKDIRKLRPGTGLKVLWEKQHVEEFEYWSLLKVAKDSQSDMLEINDDEAVALFDSTIGESVKSQNVADVPLGAFLSGGIDSSLIVAMLQKHSRYAVKTFSIGFNNKEYNEAKFAKRIAKYLETDHTELYLSEVDAIQGMKQVAKVYDEPFADSSQLPTLMVSRLASDDVTVALTGDGGDEIFGGYNRHVLANGLVNKIERIPAPLKSIARGCLEIIRQEEADSLNTLLRPLLPQKFKVMQLGNKLQKLSQILKTDNIYDYYEELLRNSHISNRSKNRISDLYANIQNFKLNEIGSYTNQVMLLDSLIYLPNDILCKVDRAAMSTGLETRTPLLDHRLIELSWRLPDRFKVRDNKGKWVLRKILEKYIPNELIERPKTGFAIPIAQWLAGPLKEWVNDLLNRFKNNEEEYFSYEIINRSWEEHLKGKKDHSQFIWSILVFQEWLELNR